MVHKQIRIPKDIAFDVMDRLGKLEDAVEFIDLTKDDLEAKKNFGGMIKRCDEMEKKIQ
jgi:predicted RNA-binding protein